MSAIGALFILDYMGVIMTRLSDLMSERTILSFEVFPPKTEAGMEKLPGTLDHLFKFQPDYISCTQGAGGKNAKENLSVCKMIQGADNATEAVAHVTCIGQTKDTLRAQLQGYLDNGITHVLALRGDLPYGWTGTNGDFNYATDLVHFIRAEFGDKFEIAISGSPEGHIAARSLEADIAHLRKKQDEGADYIMTQLCFDYDQLEIWLDAVRSAGIYLPIDAGIMPVLDKDATINMCLSHNGCAIPRELAVIISHHWFDHDPDGNLVPEVKAAFKEEGIQYTIDMIHRYMAMGVDGIHMYALNKWEDVTTILNEAGIKSL